MVLSTLNPNRSFIDSIRTAMSLCTGYLIHLSHGNNFSNGDQNCLVFAMWWGFFLLCLLRSCHKLHSHFKMLPQRDMEKEKSTGLKNNCPFTQQMPRSVPVGITRSGGRERCSGSQALWDGLAQHVLTPSAPTVPPLVTQCCKWASLCRGQPFSGSKKNLISQKAAAAWLWGRAIFRVPFSRISRHQVNSLS